jgi:hypothetical protein
MLPAFTNRNSCVWVDFLSQVVGLTFAGAVALLQLTKSNCRKLNPLADADS